MIHLRNSGFMPHDAPVLLAKAGQLVSEFGGIVRDSRVSKRYLEFDVSIEKQHLDLLVEKLKPIGKLEDARHIVEENIEKEEALKDAISYFNNERFWECHEVLEGVWKKTYEGEKDLVQGIILVAAAFVHYQKNENEICLSILNRATEKLVNATGKYHGIDVDEFKRKIAQIIKTRKIATFTV
jgi:predicted metal-dependent hydrolase